MQTQLTDARAADLSRSARPIFQTLIILCFSSLLGWQFAALFWLGDQHLYVDQLQVYGAMERPFVYRQLIPMLARLIIWITGIRVDLGLVIGIMLSAMAAVGAIGLFFREFGIRKLELHTLICGTILFVWLIKDAKIYDFATVATFAGCIILLHQHKWNGFHIVYILACLNRETAFLLTIFFMFHFFRKLDRKLYWLSAVAQVLIFLAIRLIMLLAFRENPGVVAQFNFFKNFQEFASSWTGTIAVITVFVGLTWLVARNWKSAPVFLRDIFLTFTPLLFVMWILLGRAFELRVFFEIFPVLYIMAVGIKFGSLRL